MWALRVLTGPQAGKIYDLKNGRNSVGRGAQCSIQITSTGVSKEHAEITVFPDKILVTDLRSSNGTYLNGVKIQNGVYRLGDKLGFHDVLVDVIPAQEKRAAPPPAVAKPSAESYYDGSAAVQMPPQIYTDPQYSQPLGGIPQPMGVAGAQSTEAPQPAPAYQAGGFSGLIRKVENYIETVALPGVYKLPQLFEFKLVLLMFVVAFIFATTALSMIPMVQISRSSIMKESMRRASSIARNLATVNQSALLQNSYSSLTTNLAEAEDGVEQVLIVNQSDGMILAPATRAGTTPDLPFVHVARREMRPQAVQVDSDTIGASFPIGLFDPSTGEQSIKAHAIVLYDVGSLAFDDGRVLSLFMQTLVLASLVGLLLFFFMYKLISYPVINVNAQLDAAMREKTDNMHIDFDFPPLQALIGNINSLLTRYINGESSSSSGVTGFVNKDAQAENLVQVMGYPCVAIAADGRIISCNAAFAQVAHADEAQLIGKNYLTIPDAALQQNLEGLVKRTKENQQVIHTDQLEFSGHLCILSCQALASSSQDVDFYLVTIAPSEGGS